MDNFVRIDSKNLEIYVINLDSRPDRLKQIDYQLQKIGWKYTRYSALSNITKFPSYGISKGAIGCISSHFDIIRTQMKKNSNKLLVILEDDALFCNDFIERFKYIEENFWIKDWDFFYLGGYYHLPSNVPQNWYNYDCKSRFLKDGKFQTYHLTSTKYIHLCHSIFTTHAYIVNPKSLKKIYNIMCQEVTKPHPKHQFRTRALDQIYQNLQEDEKFSAFTFTPGMITQSVSKSDIVNLEVDYDTYHKRVCGEHIYSNKLEDFNYDRYFNIDFNKSDDILDIYFIQKIHNYLENNTNINRIIDLTHTSGVIAREINFDNSILIFEDDLIKFFNTKQNVTSTNIQVLPVRDSNNYDGYYINEKLVQNVNLSDFNNPNTLFISDIKKDLINIIYKYI